MSDENQKMRNEHTLSIRARKKVKAQMEKANRDRFVAMFHHRMDLSRKGVEAFKKRDYKSALSYYFSYLDVLEKVKEVRPGQLSPKNFDPQKDAAELLMITGIYWDLAKIYDKMSGKNTTQLRQYLDRFVIFSLGMPYEKLSHEMMRKFLTLANPKHRQVFKEAFVRIGGSRCFIATAVEEHCEPVTVPTLQKYRDEVLLQTFLGKCFVRFYYCVGPFFAIRVIRSPIQFQKRLARFIDFIAKSFRSE